MPPSRAFISSTVKHKLERLHDCHAHEAPKTLGGGALFTAGPRLMEAPFGPEVLVDGRLVISFASAHYLGWNFLGPSCPVCSNGAGGRASPRRSPPVRPLALGVPRSLAVERHTWELERRLAHWVAAHDAVVGTSTLHLMLEVAGACARGRGQLFMESSSYTISRHALQLARGRGVSIGSFPAGDARALDRALQQTGRTAYVLCDAWSYPGKLKRLQDYSRICAQYGAILVVDDTQAMGILGVKPADRTAAPYGTGGAGTIRHLGLEGDHILVIASLAKAFGIPLAFAAGCPELVSAIRSGELAHACSPPDLWTVRAAHRALDLNEQLGERSRKCLQRAVAELQRALGTTGSGLFPVQSWHFDSSLRAHRVWQQLWQAGVWTLLRGPVPGTRIRASIIFLVTALHDGPLMARALSRIESAMQVAA
jgi:8-amino-7-oxononanoate synthase